MCSRLMFYQRNGIVSVAELQRGVWGISLWLIIFSLSSLFHTDIGNTDLTLTR